ncbi:IS110 family transposase [Lacihabitans soyangensis]|uniref:Transposase IS110-like N-terminal domain-containing protein n=1 Tax=Lacihabitans soyangensis TaxID=869394 RepID=A0AAE3KV08_9BACT|nr:transposase [Lacihabitans soyangensis]MCP9763716.1 hypothetical protein [Lacihabitans soyangensis]
MYQTTKSDKKESVWLSKLLLSCSLKGSFIPKVEARDFRHFARFRKKIIEEIACEKNGIIKVLEGANIKLSSVLSNFDGVAGNRIIDTLIEERVM